MQWPELPGSGWKCLGGSVQPALGLPSCVLTGATQAPEPVSLIKGPSCHDWSSSLGLGRDGNGRHQAEYLVYLTSCLSRGHFSGPCK